jgi:hypothetical protein
MSAGGRDYLRESPGVRAQRAPVGAIRARRARIELARAELSCR